MTNVIVVIGAGSIGQAIARRVSAGKQVLLADLRRENADAAAKTLGDAGFNVTTATVDVASRASVHALVENAVSLGEVFGLIHAAGVSPSQATPETILKVDLYGTALVLEEFGDVIARGGSGVVIASQSGHRLPPLSTEQNAALATTPVDELLKLPFLQPDQVKDSLHAYQLSKRGNSLRVMAEDVRWGKQSARVNTISPGIIITPLANDELTGPRGAGYRRMIEACAAKRAGTPDEVGTVGALLMGPDGAFITGSDFLMDGGVTAAYWYVYSLRNDVAKVSPQWARSLSDKPARGAAEVNPVFWSGEQSAVEVSMQDRGNHRARFAVAIAIAIVFLAGLTVAQSSPPAAPPPAATLNQLMRALFFPHSNVVFSTQRTNPSEIQRASEPSAATDPLNGVFGGWEAVENSALLLIDGSDLLMTPGRTCSNGKDVPVKAADWAKLVDQLREAGKVAYQAAKSKNTDKMFEASDVLNTACANCHNKYRRATRCQ